MMTTLTLKPASSPMVRGRTEVITIRCNGTSRLAKLLFVNTVVLTCVSPAPECVSASTLVLPALCYGCTSSCFLTFRKGRSRSCHPESCSWTYPPR